MGVVYRATDLGLDREVALKFLPALTSQDPEAKERFIREAKAASALDHANICTIYEIGETKEGHLYIAMGHYAGETLKAKVERGALPPEEAVGYASEGVDAVFMSIDIDVVDPGMAFGNAEHGTTRGCLRLLDGTVQEGDRVLDIGAGSGILSIAAAMLGAGGALAVEGDTLATETLQDNIERNGVGEVVSTLVEWADNESLRNLGPVDGIVANIEAGILTPLLPGLHSALRPGGWLILSGILDSQWSELEDAAAGAGLRPVELDADGEWRSGLFRRVD